MLKEAQLKKTTTAKTSTYISNRLIESRVHRLNHRTVGLPLTVEHSSVGLRETQLLQEREAAIVDQEVRRHSTLKYDN